MASPTAPRPAPPSPASSWRPCAQLMGYDTTQGGMAIWEYADCDQISGYAEAAMDWAVSAGILNGTSATTLNPQGTASRAQFAVMLYRFMN